MTDIQTPPVVVVKKETWHKKNREKWNSYQRKRNRAIKEQKEIGPVAKLTIKQIRDRIQASTPDVLNLFDDLIKGKPLENLPDNAYQMINLVKMFFELLQKYPIDEAGGFANMTDDEIREYIKQLTLSVEKECRPKFLAISEFPRVEKTEIAKDSVSIRGVST